MKDQEFTQNKLDAIARHELEMLEEEVSILQAIEVFKLDKMSRTALEKIAARSLLELSNLEDSLKLLEKVQRQRVLESLQFFKSLSTGIFKGNFEKVRNFDRLKGSKARNEKDPKRLAIVEIEHRWDCLKKASEHKLPRKTKQKFLDEVLDEVIKKYAIDGKLELDRKYVESQLKY